MMPGVPMYPCVLSSVESAFQSYAGVRKEQTPNCVEGGKALEFQLFFSICCFDYFLLVYYNCRSEIHCDIFINAQSTV